MRYVILVVIGFLAFVSGIGLVFVDVIPMSRLDTAIGVILLLVGVLIVIFYEKMVVKVDKNTQYIL